MILLKPILHDFSEEDVIWVDKPKSKNLMRVHHGNPMSQQDGYLSSNWMGLNKTYIVGEERSPAFGLKRSDGPLHYNTGPPYLATVRDMYRMTVKWTEFAPRVYDVFPRLFAEMFGYCYASAHLELPHTMIKSIVVSTTTTTNREGWELVDAIPNDEVCNPPSTANLPFALHYCKRYLLGKFFFSKYRLRKDYLSCDTPLLVMPPNNITELDYWIAPPAKRTTKGATTPPDTRNVTKKIAKREAFMICGLISKVNEAVEYFKMQHCGGRANFNRTYNFHDSPHD
jgi:hypothetical protein